MSSYWSEPEAYALALAILIERFNPDKRLENRNQTSMKQSKRGMISGRETFKLRIKVRPRENVEVGWARCVGRPFHWSEQLGLNRRELLDYVDENIKGSKEHIGVNLE